MKKHFVNLFIIAVLAIPFLPTFGHAQSAPPWAMTLGPTIPGDTEFVFPDGIAVDRSGHIYVIDLAGFIRKFNSSGTFMLGWGGTGSGLGQFSGAPGIAADNSYVYVADMGNHRIQKFTTDGVFVTTWGTRGSALGQFNWPWDIAIGPDGLLYISDQGNFRIQVFTADGVFVRAWGSIGYGNGQFYLPYGVAIDRNTGNVYTVENNATNTVRVQKFTSGGTFLTKWGTGGTANGQFNHPMKVAVEPSTGNVYVTDKDNNRVQAFTGDGAFLFAWGVYGTDDGQFNLPFGIVFDAYGNVIVTEHYNHRLQWFGPGTAGVEPGSSVARLQLAPAMPNPWSNRTALRFSLATHGRAALSIYDLSGRRLKQWTWSTLPAGPQEVDWDGRTDDGQSVAPGVMFYRLETGGQAINQKMVRVQ